MNNRTRTAIQLGSLSFILFSTLAMVFYPGGYNWNPTASHYSFVFNFLSDLGLWKVNGTTHEYLSNVFFVTALLSAAFAVRIFFSALLNRIQRGFSVGNTASMLSSLLLVALGFLPSDLFFWPHRIVAVGIFTTLAVAFGALAIQRNGRGSILLCLLLALYVLYAIFGPRPEAGLTYSEIHSVMQKTAVYLTFIFMIYKVSTTPNHA